MSFGGSLMTPVLDHYGTFSRETAPLRTGIDGSQAGQVVESRYSITEGKNLLQDQLDLLSSSIRHKVRNEIRMTLPFYTIIAGLSIKIILLVGALVAMHIVSTGSIFISWCMISWWIYAWYAVVTLIAILDSWAQLPFDHFVKLYLTDIRVQYRVSEGALLTVNTHENLKQLQTLPCANFEIQGNHERTSARNTLLVVVSIARDINDPKGRSTSAVRYVVQIFARLCSLTIYVFGTVLFSSTSLLTLPMAEMLLMFILGAGVLSRAVARQLVKAITSRSSMVHIITKNETEANRVVEKIIEHQREEDETKFQVEIDGHLFLEGRRVTRRSIWWRRILGLLANPFDLTRLSTRRETISTQYQSV